MRASDRPLLLAFSLAGAICTAACEDPARPGPRGELGATVFVDSDPRGGDIFVNAVATGQVTPSRVIGLPEGAFTIRVTLDSAGVTYAFSDFVTLSPQLPDARVGGPLTLRCTTPQCLRDAAEFHAAGDIRFALNAAGPPFLYDGLDVGIVWPLATSNSYSSLGAATATALVDGAPVSIGLRNIGVAPNFWAGRPAPAVLSTAPHRVSVPAWITPPTSTTGLRLRGIEVVHEVSADATHDNVLHVQVTWTNISADSLYRLLDPASPEAGITYADAWLGFLLDADVGAFAESDDDLVSYDPALALVFAYDGDFRVNGFSGGWSAQPGLIGLMVLEGPGQAPRLNAWPRSSDFLAGADAAGRALVSATQSLPANHPDPRIGFAPDAQVADYILSAAVGPVDLPPGASVSARFAIILAPPVQGTFTSGSVMPAGDPLDGARPLASTAALLLETARSLRNATP